MKYILVIWLAWASGETTVLKLSPIPDIIACMELAELISKQTIADGVIYSFWDCNLLEEKETRDA